MEPPGSSGWKQVVIMTEAAVLQRVFFTFGAPVVAVVGVGVVDLGEVSDDRVIDGEHGGRARLVGEGSSEVAGVEGAVHDPELGFEVFESLGVAGVTAGGIGAFVHRPARPLAQRRPGRGADRFVITLDEAAALWHLPGEPAQYGITDATARIRRPRRDLDRFNPPQPRRRKPESEGDHDAAA
jgi:hypothetical protein